MKKIIAPILLLMAITFAFALTSCSAAENVNRNLSKAADNFECLRKITVYNARTDLEGGNDNG